MQSRIAKGKHPKKTTNTFSKMGDAAMRFEIKEGVVDCKMIKTSREDVDGNVCKEDLPIILTLRPKRLSSSS